MEGVMGNGYSGAALLRYFEENLEESYDIRCVRGDSENNRKLFEKDVDAYYLRGKDFEVVFLVVARDRSDIRMKGDLRLEMKFYPKGKDENLFNEIKVCLHKCFFSSNKSDIYSLKIRSDSVVIYHPLMNLDELNCESNSFCADKVSSSFEKLIGYLKNIEESLESRGV